MNVNKIIKWLKKFSLIEEMPDEYVVSRREQEYRELIERIEPYRFTQEDGLEITLDNPNISEFLVIPNGDIEFPEIDLERIKREITKEGIEALAWYRSFHWHPPERWGIYILDKGVYYIAKNIFGMIDQISPQGRRYNTLDLLQQSFRLLFLHEFFHYITDIAATALEMGNRLVRPHYVIYIRNVYMRSINENEPIEEALANAFAYNRFYGSAVRRQLLFFMESQPAGYSAFKRYTPKSNFTNGLRVLGSYISHWKHGVPAFAPLEILFDYYSRSISFGDVPIYIVTTIKDSRYILRIVTSISRSDLIESTTFKKDLQRLPPYIIQKYQKTLDMLGRDVRVSGLKFEKIRGCDAVYTVRVDREYRLSMRQLNGKWELLRIAKHDEVYRNPGC